MSKEINEENDDSEQKSVYDCQKRYGRINLKELIQVELHCLNKQNIFGLTIFTPKICETCSVQIDFY